MLATTPMTLAMMAVQQLLPETHRTRHEPDIIVDVLLRRFGLAGPLNKRQRRGLALVGHPAYGALAGAVVGLVRPGDSLPRGVLAGLGIWAASYAGWLPASRVLPWPYRRTLSRNALLLVAHAVWGASAARMVRTAEAALGR
jgi:hypothetical protein